MGSLTKMSNHEIEIDAMEAEYGDEIMSAGWNPDVDLVCQELHLVSASEQMTMPRDESVISEMFLRRMYSYQH